MLELSNIQVAVITSGAVLISALLTGALIYLIERGKELRRFKRNQTGILSLLLEDVQSTALSLEALWLSLVSQVDQNSTSELSYTTLKLFSKAADSLALPVSIDGYKYMPEGIGPIFVLYFRRLNDLKVTCEYLESIADKLSEHQQLVMGSLNIVGLCLSICYDLIAAIYTHQGDTTASDSHRELAKDIKKRASIYAQAAQPESS